MMSAHHDAVETMDPPNLKRQDGNQKKGSDANTMVAE